MIRGPEGRREAFRYRCEAFRFRRQEARFPNPLFLFSSPLSTRATRDSCEDSQVRRRVSVRVNAIAF